MNSPTAVAASLRTYVQRNKQQAMQRTVLAGERFAKQEVPVKQGTLRRSITSRVEQGGDRGVIGTNLKYAEAVHEGTRPHRIAPIRKKALMWKGAKHPVRAVNHPGTKPNKFLERTRERLRAVAEREFGQGWNL